jgi:aminopeptidase N
MKKKILIICLMLISPIVLFAQGQTTTYFNDPNTKPVELIIDLQHLDAFVKFEPDKNRVIAKTIFTFRTKRIETDSIVFYAPTFQFSSVEIEGIPIEYHIAGKNIIIYPKKILLLNKSYKIIFNYKVAPEDGNPYFVGWNDPNDKMRKQIWAHRPHGWLPFIDDRLTVDMHITFDKNYLVYSNGVRMDVKDNGNGTKTWHYRMGHNHPFFSTALVVGKYAYKTVKSKSGVSEELWYYPEYPEKFETTYRYSADMIDFFEEQMGLPYPWEMYRQAPVADYLFGAMETTTSTIFGDYMYIDSGAYWQRNYINVNAHELSHQWFGNYISHLTPRDGWLTESFATFWAKMFERHVFGEDYYQNDKLNELKKTFSIAAKNSNPIASSRAGTFRIYQKGSLVLDMLRYVLGDEYFKMSIKEYLTEHPYEYVETNDFLRAIYMATGMNLDWFFEEWLYRGGEPHFKVNYIVADDDDGNRFTLVAVEQIHKKGPLVKNFKMPIDFIVYYRDGSSDSVRAWVKNDVSYIKVPNPRRKNIDFVLFDPHNRILKKVTFKKDYNELAAQALKAPDMIDRYDALVGLRNYDLHKKIDLFKKMYDQETFHLTKGEIIYQIGKEFENGELATTRTLDMSDDTPLMIIKKAINDADALVRRAVLDYVKDIHVDLKKEYMKLLNDVSYANVELALGNLAAAYPRDLNIYLDKTKDKTGWRGKNIRMKWLELAVLDGKEEYLNELLDYATVSYDFETRMNAIATLKKLNYLDYDYIKSLFSAASYWNYKLRNVAVNAIKYYSEQDKYRRMLRESLKSYGISQAQKQKIKKILE